MNVYLSILLVITAAVMVSSKSSIFDENGDEAWPVGRLNERSGSETKGSDFETVTIKVGREAVLPCFINNLGSYKVVWSKNGDVLSYGVEKINMDRRLKIQHRYVSEWHLIIDNVAADDEGDYICKATGGFYKTIRLEVLMPPTINDLNSVPAGTINLKEDSSITLKCHAEGKPRPSVKWYRWRVNENKEELSETGYEITLSKITRNDPNKYECIATNSVPPATSRIFNIEIHFLPVVRLSSVNSNAHSFSMECHITANPLETVTWYKNGQILATNYNHERLLTAKNFQIVPETNLDSPYKHSLALTVKHPQQTDFTEYQCCAKNAYGQVCDLVKINEPVTSKPEWIPKPEFNFGLMNSKILGSLSATTLEVPRAIFNKDMANKTAHADGMVGASIGDKRRHYPADNFLSIDSNSDAAKQGTSGCLLTVALFVVLLQRP